MAGPVERYLERREKQRNLRYGERLTQMPAEESPPRRPGGIRRWWRRQFEKPDGMPRYTLIAVMMRWLKTRRSLLQASGFALAAVSVLLTLFYEGAFRIFLAIITAVLLGTLAVHYLTTEPPDLGLPPRR